MSRWRKALQQWITRRAPRAPSVTLSQNRIYLLPTRFGLLLFGVAVLVWIGALNYAVSLAYVLSFWIIALLLLSVFMAYRQLAGLALRAEAAGAVFAGERADFVLHLVWPQAEAGRLRLGWQDGGERERWQDDGRVLLALAAPRRGQLAMPPLQVWSEAPLGLIRAFAPLRLAASVWVYPQPLPDARAAMAAGGEDAPLLQRRDGDEFAGLAAWQPAQGMHRIAWRVYARSQVLAAREFVSLLPQGQQWQLDWSDYPPAMAVEERLSRLCWRLLQAQQAGATVVLNLPQQQLLLADGAITPGLLALAQFGVRDAS
ncbi:DUF58 domain-containing protein [Vogesella facilis]|uniref:DUF58 domain-containing protein n=1 Tax=Vogesella facilis TaxID=1655232 RepID=A0ABV7RDK2_9NEIS